MDLTDIPLFGMLKGRMGYLTQRQQVVAQNVANADTPGFTPQDLKPFTIQPTAPAMAMVSPSMTNPMHLAGIKRPSGASPYKPVTAPDSETTLDGNQVVLEEQMMKMTEARLDYDAAVGFYQKSLNLLRMAARAPGRG